MRVLFQLWWTELNWFCVLEPSPVETPNDDFLFTKLQLCDIFMSEPRKGPHWLLLSSSRISSFCLLHFFQSWKIVYKKIYIFLLFSVSSKGQSNAFNLFSFIFSRCFLIFARRSFLNTHFYFFFWFRKVVFLNSDLLLHLSLLVFLRHMVVPSVVRHLFRFLCTVCKCATRTNGWCLEIVVLKMNEFNLQD